MDSHEFRQRIALVLFADNEASPSAGELALLMRSPEPDFFKDREAALRWNRIAYGRWLAKYAGQVAQGYEEYLRGN